ncbi:MAG: alpha/beta hydrolase [Nonomuraea sp.]|nr:alpha/beta hydrolase [Streptomyces sp.]NUP67475.1 alpha/beta hydrolase [Nonomuraea sp.]NUP82818.1 alpha/beta hydrolase [Nonomuraea sp.]NUS07658.1 alpha/beta hydrolase [Nonomuraea sp.]
MSEYQVVTSADGTRVEYLSVGRGPDVVVVPGALAMASDFGAFAGLLAVRHTVHVVQRRGRGGSGPQGDRYGIERECEDIEAVRARTGARLIFGHSFGGLATLRAACGNPAYDAVAVYEPGVSVGGSIPVDWIGRARRELSEGADFEAFVTFVRGVNPDQTGRVPRRLLRIILRRAIPRAELRQNLALMPQAVTEHVEVGRFDGRLDDYRGISAPTLVMRGKGRDTGRQAVALARLAETIPRAETAAFRGLDHFAPEKKPGEVADAVLRFFAAHISDRAQR